MASASADCTSGSGSGHAGGPSGRTGVPPSIAGRLESGGMACVASAPVWRSASRYTGIPAPRAEGHVDTQTQLQTEFWHTEDNPDVLLHTVWPGLLWRIRNPQVEGELSASLRRR